MIISCDFGDKGPGMLARGLEGGVSERCSARSLMIKEKELRLEDSGGGVIERCLSRIPVIRDQECWLGKWRWGVI